MEWVEITASSVEAAKERALDELGVDAQEAEFVVEEEPRPGLFGRVRGQARVRARVLPRSPRPKTERRDRRRRPKAKGGDRGPAPTAPAPSEPAHRGGRRRSRRRGDGGAAPAEDAAVTPDRPAPAGERSGPQQRAKEPTVNEITLEQQAETVADFLAGLLETFEFDGELSIQEVDEENMEVAVHGDDLGLLIGPRGQTLQAVAEIGRAASMQALAGRHPGRVHIDIAGYRQRRREALADFARSVADEVVSSGTAKALEPMSPADRKVVHDTVNEIEGVTTVSEGEDARRRVVIEPVE